MNLVVRIGKNYDTEQFSVVLVGFLLGLGHSFQNQTGLCIHKTPITCYAYTSGNLIYNLSCKLGEVVGDTLGNNPHDMAYLGSLGEDVGDTLGEGFGDTLRGGTGGGRS